MHSDQQRALISVVLLATFTNSAGPDCRRKEACHDADPLTTDIDVPNLAKIYENIMLWSAHLDATATALDTPELRRLAFEMAMCMCDADSRVSDVEG